MMEPSVTPPPSTITKPLSEFQKIAHNTYLWTTASYQSTSSATTPLILLYSWNGAAAKHIAKYTVAYQKLFPTSRILLTRCFTPDIYRTSAATAPLLSPALEIVAEHTYHGGEVLVHSFSNGGGNQINEFAKAWKGRFGTKLPMHAQILDSSPTKGQWMKSHAAITASLPRNLFWRWFGSTLVHLLLLGSFISDKIMRRENKMVIICRELNDEKVFDASVPRVYLYSRADAMVSFEEADGHADIAISKGWDVTKVQFENSAHCGHVREDEAKYWAAVMEAWKTGPREE